MYSDDDDYMDESPSSEMSTKRMILWIVAIILCILTVFHFLKWHNGQSNETIAIRQQSIDEIDRISVDYIDQPLVIDMIEDDTLEYNMLEYQLYSPLGIFRHYIDADMNQFTSNPEYVERHFHGVFAIKPDSDIVVVYQTPDRSHTSFIVVHPHNILLIPRWGVWRIEPYDKITKGANTTSENGETVEEPHTPTSNEIRVETYSVDTPWTKTYRWFAKCAIYLGFKL
jgi:hypothetical protein